jgi:hypothetical protein
VAETANTALSRAIYDQIPPPPQDNVALCSLLSRENATSPTAINGPSVSAVSPEAAFAGRHVSVRQVTASSRYLLQRWPRILDVSATVLRSSATNAQTVSLRRTSTVCAILQISFGWLSHGWRAENCNRKEP